MSDYIVHKAIELSNLSAKAVAAITEDEWIISPKYDGCHAIFAFDNGNHVATYSRSGETVLSMPHIAKALLEHYPIQVGRIAIQGEAWMLGKAFSDISGIFRRQSPQPELGFVPFDIVPFDYNTDASGPPILLGQLNNRPYPAPYKDRLKSLYTQRAYAVSNVFAPRWYTALGSLQAAFDDASAYAKTQKALTHGQFDGAVLAQANGRYSVGSGKGGEFIKCKPLLSETVTVNALFPALGEKTGKNTLALGFTLNGKPQKVSTGLTQEQVDSYIADYDLILGERIEVEAMGLTVNGLLREPRFKGIRTDA